VVSDPRYALIFDDETTGLGSVALQLIRLGTDVFYAKDPDEVALLCTQAEASKVAAVIVPETIDGTALTGLVARLTAQIGEGPLALIAIGEMADEQIRQGLRKAGVRWSLRTPFDESTLRWVVNAAMCPYHRGAQRQHPRVPTTLLARAFLGTRRKDLLLSTLSEGGAFLETPFPFEEGTRLTLEIPLPEAPVTVKGSVRYTMQAVEDGRQSFPCGMGIVFEEPAPRATQALRAYVDEQACRFSV